MQINNSIHCIKPRKFGNFTGNTPKEKVRYKHYEEINDETLRAKSIVKAHKQVENSPKMHLYKALPAIGAAIIGTGVALTQPGKLSSKVSAGLGFLALYKAGDIIIDNLNKKDEKSPFKKWLIATGTVAAGAFGFAAMAKKTNPSTKLGNFVKKEINTLAKEINSTKAGEFVQNKIEPVLTKNKAKASKILTAGTILTALGTSFAEVKLGKSLNKDFKQNAQQNYLKGKLIQQEARKHFDKIDAVEV